VNRQIVVGDFKFVIVSDPLLLGHVKLRIYSPLKVNKQRFCVLFINTRSI